MPDEQPTELLLQKLCADMGEREYESLSLRYRALDSKSTALTGTAGVFLAAAFAFARLDSKALDVRIVGSIAISLLLLLSTIGLCVLASRIRAFHGRLRGEYIRNLVDPVI